MAPLVQAMQAMRGARHQPLPQEQPATPEQAAMMQRGIPPGGMPGMGPTGGARMGGGAGGAAPGATGAGTLPIAAAGLQSTSPGKSTTGGGGLGGM